MKKNVLVYEEGIFHSFAGLTLRVIVGADVGSQTFFVHRDLITSRSHFFAKALKTYFESEADFVSWAERNDGLVRLPEDDPKVFANYLHLIYQAVVPVRAMVKRDITALSSQELDDVIEDAVMKEYVALSKLYVFCEKVGDIQSKALVINAFVEAVHLEREDENQHFPGPASINIVYGGTVDDDPLRKFCVDVYALQAFTAWFEGADAHDYNHQFLFDVMAEMSKVRDTPSDQSKIEYADDYCKMLRDANHEEDGGPNTPDTTDE